MSLFDDERFEVDLRPASPRILRIRLLLWLGGPMVAAGLICCAIYPLFLITWLSVPGATLVLLAWVTSDADLARVESGHLDHKLGSFLHSARRWSFGLLIASALSFMVQIVLLVNGTYEEWLGRL